MPPEPTPPTPIPTLPPQSLATPSSGTSRLPWIIAALLAVGIVAIIVIWRPWQPTVKASDRTISVTGDATVTATPDQYVFSPTYTSTNADQQTALSGVATKSTQLVAGLKALGVANANIKTNSSGYNDGGGIYLPVQAKGGSFTYTLSLTITVNDATLAQKVQNYLVSTSPTGDVSPEVDFSTAKQSSLQDQARTQAEKDARSKADQSAANLGFKVDAVKSVTDGSLNNGEISPLTMGAADDAVSAAAPQLSVQPGQNQLDYSVAVVYYIH